MSGNQSYQPLTHQEETTNNEEINDIETTLNLSYDTSIENGSSYSGSYKDASGHNSGSFHNTSWESAERSEGSNHRALHHVRSASGSSLGSLFDDDDVADEDDEAEVRRYNLQPRMDVPLPAEFMPQYSWPEQLKRAFADLQTHARQRRAARLLNMPSQSARHRLRASFITWCCDETDYALLLAGIWLVAWLVVGLAARLGSGWWWTGATLLLVRLAGRRCLEYFTTSGKRMANTMRRERLPTAEALELGAWMNQQNRARSNTDG